MKPYSYARHDVTIDDPWHWLKDPNYPQVADPEILACLTAENDYFQAAMQPRAALVETLFEEMKGRIKEDDAGVPQRDGDWLYWWAFRTGGQYRIWYRKPVGGGAEAVILDEPAQAEGKEYFRLGALSVSPDGRLLAYSIDDNGSERFTLRIRDLGSANGTFVRSFELILMSSGARLIAHFARPTPWIARPSDTAKPRRWFFRTSRSTSGSMMNLSCSSCWTRSTS